jgi:hypothetical protein
MATNAIFERVINDGAAGATTGGIGSAKTSGRIAVAMYVVFGAGTSAGVVTLETAPNAEWTGTWASLGTATWSAANDVKYVRADGPVGAIRARISTAIVGGTVDVYLLACD